VFARQERLSFALAPSEEETTYFTGNDQYPALDAWLLEAFLRRLETTKDDRGRLRVLNARERTGQSRSARRLNPLDVYREYRLAVPGSRRGQQAFDPLA
jgi:hypothetical protein